MGKCSNPSAESTMLWHRKGVLIIFIFKDFPLLGYTSNDRSIFKEKNIQF